MVHDDLVALRIFRQQHCHVVPELSREITLLEVPVGLLLLLMMLLLMLMMLLMRLSGTGAEPRTGEHNRRKTNMNSKNMNGTASL